MKQLMMYGILIIISCIAAGISCAEPSIDIQVQPVFHAGENIQFSYTIQSSSDEQIKYVASVDCMNSPRAPLEMKDIDLIAGKAFEGKYIYGELNEDVKTGKCIASIMITEPYKMQSEKDFIVENLGDLSLETLVCTSIDCKEQSKVYIKGEKIYLDYNSISGVNLKSSVIMPDSSSKDITLPASIDAKDIGMYELVIIASKEGFRDLETREQFAVIENEPQIPYASFNTASGKDAARKSSKPYWIIGALAIIIGFSMVFYYRRRQ